MKHYNPELENKILADLTPRRTGTDHGFISFVKADPNTDSVDLVEAVESNHIWMNIASATDILYENADALVSDINFCVKIYKSTASSFNKNIGTSWQLNGDGSIKTISNQTLRTTRATGYLDRNINGTHDPLVDGAFDVIPGTSTTQTVTPTLDVTATPFTYNPVSYFFNTFKIQFERTEKMGCIDTDYNGANNPSTFNGDNFTFNEDRSYIPRATVFIDVPGVGNTTIRYAAPVVSTNEYFHTGNNNWRISYMTAEFIEIGKSYSTPSINNGQPYIYNPTTGIEDADILSNQYPVSVTTSGGVIVDGGIYDFGYDEEDTLTYYIQQENGLSSTDGIGASQFNDIINNPANQDKGLLTGILPGILSIYYGDRTENITVAEMVTGTGTTFSADVMLDNEASLHAEGDITTQGSLLADSISVANVLTVLPHELYTQTYESITSQTVTEDVNSAVFNFIGSGRFLQQGGAPNTYFETVDYGADYYFVSGGIDLNGAYQVDQVFKYVADEDNFTIDYSLSPGANEYTYTITNPGTIQKLKTASLATLNLDPALDESWQGLVVDTLVDDDFESITTGDINTISATTEWAVTIEPGDSRDVIIDEDLIVGGDITLEGRLTSNSPICAPYDINHSNTAVSESIRICSVNYITASDDSAARTYTLPRGREGDWIKLAIRSGRSDVEQYSFAPFTGDRFETILGDPLIIAAQFNQTLELTYISNSVGWVVTSTS